jgi:hypothetical protein
LKIYERARKVLQLLITPLVSANFPKFESFYFSSICNAVFCKMIISRVVGKIFALLF